MRRKGLSLLISSIQLLSSSPSFVSPLPVAYLSLPFNHFSCHIRLLFRALAAFSRNELPSSTYLPRSRPPSAPSWHAQSRSSQSPRDNAVTFPSVWRELEGLIQFFQGLKRVLFVAILDHSAFGNIGIVIQDVERVQNEFPFAAKNVFGNARGMMMSH